MKGEGMEFWFEESCFRGSADWGKYAQNRNKAVWCIDRGLRGWTYFENGIKKGSSQ